MSWPLALQPAAGLGKPRLLERVGQVRDAAAAALGEPGITRGSRRRELASSSSLTAGRCARRSRARSSCSSAPGRQASRRIPAPTTIWRWPAVLLARVLKTAGGSEQALPLLDEARQRFESIAKSECRQGAEANGRPSASQNKATVFLTLGRLDEAAAAYEESIRRAEQLERRPACRRRQRPAWDRPPTAAPLPGGAGGICRSARAVHAVGRTGHRRCDLASDRHGVSGSGPAGSGGGCLPEIARDQGAARRCRRAGEHARINSGILYDDDLGRTEEAVAFSGKRRTSMSRSATSRRKAGRETISAYTCASSTVWTKHGRKSAERSNATRSSATRPSRGRLGPSSPTSRRTPATPLPPRKRRARPSPATSPTAATAARTTTGQAASAWP